MDTEAVKIIGTIGASVLSSSGLSWKIAKYYILKEVHEPIARSDKKIIILEKELDLMKKEMKDCSIRESETKAVLVELSTKLNFITETLANLSREVMTLIKHEK